VEFGVFVDPIGVYKSVTRGKFLVHFMVLATAALAMVAFAVLVGWLVIVVGAFRFSPIAGIGVLVATPWIIWMIRPKRQALNASGLRLASFGVTFDKMGQPVKAESVIAMAVAYTRNQHGQVEAKSVKANAQADLRLVQVCAKWRLRLADETRTELNRLAIRRSQKLEELNRPFTVAGKLEAWRDRTSHRVRRLGRLRTD